MTTKTLEINLEQLFDMAQSRGETDAVENNLAVAAKLYRRSYEMRRLLKSDFLPKEEKIKILRELPYFEKSPLFFEFMLLVLETNLVEKLSSFQTGFSRIVCEKLNRLMIYLVTAVDLSDDEITGIRVQLEKLLSCTVYLHHSVDDHLVGGMILKLPDGKIFDFSYNRRLSDFKYFLMERN